MSPNTPHSRDDSEPRRKNGQREYRNYRSNQNRPRHPDKEIDERIRELDAEREQLAREPRLLGPLHELPELQRQQHLQLCSLELHVRHKIATNVVP